MRLPKSDPPMPMLTMSVIGSPVLPFIAPACSASAIVAHAISCGQHLTGDRVSQAARLPGTERDMQRGALSPID